MTPPRPSWPVFVTVWVMLYMLGSWYLEVPLNHWMFVGAVALWSLPRLRHLHGRRDA